MFKNQNTSLNQTQTKIELTEIDLEILKDFYEKYKETLLYGLTFEDFLNLIQKEQNNFTSYDDTFFNQILSLYKEFLEFYTNEIVKRTNTYKDNGVKPTFKVLIVKEINGNKVNDYKYKLGLIYHKECVSCKTEYVKDIEIENFDTENEMVYLKPLVECMEEIKNILDYLTKRGTLYLFEVVKKRIEEEKRKQRNF